MASSSSPKPSPNPSAMASSSTTKPSSKPSPKTPTFAVVPFAADQHSHLTPYFAALHAMCITHDRVRSTFLPPLSNDKLLTWWKDRINEAARAERLILLLLQDWDPKAPVHGPELAGIVMLTTLSSETEPFRADVEHLLVSIRFRRNGGARMLVAALEADALRRGRHLLMVNVQTGTAAETVFGRLGFVKLGVVPRSGIAPGGDVRDTTLFYKHLKPAASTA